MAHNYGTTSDEWPQDFEIDAEKLDDTGRLRIRRAWAHTPALRDIMIAVLGRSGLINITWRTRKRVHPQTWKASYTGESEICSKATDDELATLNDSERQFIGL